MSVEHKTKIRRVVSQPMPMQSQPGHFFQRELIAVYIKQGEDVDELLRLMAEGREVNSEIEIAGIKIIVLEHVYPCAPVTAKPAEANKPTPKPKKEN